MISYLQAVLIGLLQGVTELFPVSSLGHSVLVPAFIGTLHVAWGELALGGNLLHFARETLVGIAVDHHLNILTETNPAQLRFRHIDLHP